MITLRRLLLLLALLTAPAAAQTVGSWQNWCQAGGVDVSTSGINSLYPFQASYPKCQVEVFLTGTATPATIYSTITLTPLANPFCANLDGSFLLYASIASNYDVVMSNANACNPVASGYAQLPATFTFWDVCVSGGCGGGGGGSGTVTSVGLVAPTGMTISGSPVTGAGTLTWGMPTGWNTGSMLIGNGSNSVTYLQEVDGMCAVGSGGQWSIGACGSGGGVTGSGTANNYTGWVTSSTIGNAPAGFSGNDTLFKGLVATAKAAGIAGGFVAAGDTNPPTVIPATGYFGFIGFNSSSAGSFILVPNATAPTVNQVAIFGTPATCTGSSVNCIPLNFGLVGASNLNPQYSKLRCESGLGDGLNAITSGTYLQSFCYNDSGVTWTITGLKCFTDNNGTSTMNAAGNSLGALLTGSVTCTTAFAAGTQSANVALTSGDYIKFTFVADGTSKQTTWVVSFTQ